MRGDGSEAAAAHGRDDCAFRLHALAGLGIVRGRHQMLVARPNLERERTLVVLLRQRGLPVPAAPTRETAHTLYFCIGILAAGWELVRIYMLHGGLI